ncbi:CD1375 family protein [Anaerosinus massiliensis]|nr:CD1375 family protein [Massilibacillus massiliensis]
MIYKYKIIAYAILVRGGRMALEAEKNSTLEVVPEAYQIAVAEYLAK